MIVSPIKEHFVVSIDTLGYRKTAEYQASIIKKYIEEIGLNNVVQIAIDNAIVINASTKIIITKYAHPWKYI